MADCKLVIFDCDGTLMDSETIVAEIETAALAEYDVKIETTEFLRRFAGSSEAVLRTFVLEEFGRHLPDDWDKDISEQVQQRLWREVKAVDGVHEMLDRLDQPRCICSNAGMRKLEIELTRAELWNRFRPYVYSAMEIDGVGSKPAPDIFLHAAREFETDPSNCLVIEDSVSGVLGARAAGMRVIGFAGASHTYPGHADVLTEAGAETVIKRLADIPAIVDAFSFWEGATI